MVWHTPDLSESAVSAIVLRISFSSHPFSLFRRQRPQSEAQDIQIVISYTAALWQLFGSLGEEMKATTRFRFLGPPQVEQDGDPILGFRSRKALALLGYLAAQKRPLPRSHLAGLFWEDLPEDRGRANLSWVLHQVSSLVPDCLRTNRHTIELRRSPSCWVDIDAFSTLEREGGTTALKTAAGLYRGPFLEGIELEGCAEFEIWLAREREWWRQRLAEVLHTLIRLCGQGAENEKGLRFARQLLALEPWRERSHRETMRLLTRCGQWTAALAQYETCRQILDEELGVEPSERTRTLYERIRAARETPRHNLPPQPTPFVGRGQEVADVLRLLDRPDCRLLTLLGPGGIGKTRLALKAASSRTDAFLEGVWFVPLASVSSPDFLVSAMASTLQMAFSGHTDARTDLLNQLRHKEMLLILDSFEHLLAASDLLTQILREAPDVKLLVTSRAALNLRWEWRHELEGLTYPVGEEVDAGNPEAYSAVTLFQETARRVNPRFSPSSCERQAVVRICQLVEGMPLAIELAAAWSKTHTCESIAREIDQDLGFLTNSLQDVPPRHRSIQAAFEHSWRLLASDEQNAFMRLSVFRCGFDGNAASAVTDASPAILESLVDRSLLCFATSGRYTMHNLLRHYASNKLRSTSSWQAMFEQRHASHYLALLRRLGDRSGGEDMVGNRGAIEADIANVRAAWRWAARHGKASLISQTLPSLSQFYLLAGPYQEGQTLIGMAIDYLQSTNSPETAETSASEDTVGAALIRLLAEKARFLNRQGLYDQAIEAARDVIKLREDVNVNAAEATTYAYLQWGRALVRKGSYAAAETQLRRALALSKVIQARQIEVNCLRSLGNARHGSGDYANAADYYGRALVISQELGDRRSESALLANLGLAAHQQGIYDAARANYERALHLSREIGDRRSESLALINLAYISDQQGAYREAEALYELCHRISREIGDRQGETMALSCLGLLFHHKGDERTARQFGERAVATARAIGARRVQGYALTRLGHALLGLGHLRAAENTYQEAISLRQELGERGRLLESRAGLARALVAQGELDRAKRQAEEILSKLASSGLNDTDEPLRIYLTCYHVLHACGDSRADNILLEAHDKLEERAARIEDGDLRRSFLESVTAHRKIVKAYGELQEAKKGVSAGDRG